MPTAELSDVSLYYEEHGQGPALIWCHEFAGDYRSWGPQLTEFSRHFRNIVFSARGYPGSSCPDEPAAYSQELMVEDVAHLLDHLGIDQAIVGGLSMGGNVALNFGLAHPDRTIAMIIAGCGSGSTNRQAWEDGAAAIIAAAKQGGIQAVADLTATNPTRTTMAAKDPFGFAQQMSRMAEHSAIAAGHIYRGVQLARASVLSLGEQMQATDIPALVLFGDLDEPCVEPGLYMWRQLPRARLGVFPNSGHAINLEEPALFNAMIRSFLADVVGRHLA